LWTKAWDCEPGCHCVNIHLEYDQIISWQKQIQALIAEETRTLETLITTEATILESCPDYADKTGEYGDQEKYINTYDWATGEDTVYDYDY